MRLRKLRREDAPLMLEWMHDEEVVRYMSADFRHKTLADCEAFIEVSKESRENLHLAIEGDDGEYAGTVSLKRVDSGNQSAEFAITVRQTAMGTGCASFAMREILRHAFKGLGLTVVYWCVAKNNGRALRFYDKNGYVRTNSYRGGYTASGEPLVWYAVRKEDFPREEVGTEK